MLEILLVVFLCRGMGKLLRNKGRKPLLFQILLVLSWIGGELLGGVAGGIIHVLQHGDQPFEPGLSVYLLALCGAVCGAGFWFLVAWLLPSAQPSSAAPFAPGGEAFQLPADADPNNPYMPPTTRG